MRWLLAAFLTFFLAACTLWPEKRDPGWDEATGIEHFERLVWKEIKDKDWKELEARMASNFIHNTKDATLDKQQTLDLWKSFALDDYTLGDFIVVHNGDTATATYVSSFRAATPAGEKIDRTGLRRMSVWQRQKSGWVLIALADLN